MPYKIIVRPDARQHLPDVIPEEARDAIRNAFEQIKSDPMGVSRVPPCPPFVPHGRLHDFPVDVNDRRHYFRIFFEVDSHRNEVGITHIGVQPRFDS